MSLFSRLFRAADPKQAPDILFGRFSDSYKDDAKYDAWDLAIEAYESEAYLQSFHHFLEFLTGDHRENVSVEEKAGTLAFEILQGSKTISGVANDEKIRVIGKIARVQEKHIGWMRRLLENNYNLKYGRYCLDEDGDIAIVFDSYSLDASPYKLYYGIKEIALAADKHDDLMVEEFESLQPVNTGHIIEIPALHKTVKANYIRQTIEQVMEEVHEGRLNPTQYPGGITYLLLDAVYKLDFLTRPEGHTMETLERMHRSFFESNGLNNVQKNHQLIREFSNLLQRPDDKLQSELYRTVFTFGIINPSNHEAFKNIVDVELNNMDWYVEHRHEQVALAVPGYIVGHALFSFSFPEPDKELLMLYYQIIEQDYFNKLGFSLEFVDAHGKLRKRHILEAIGQIVADYKHKYPYLDPSYDLLNFDHRILFAKSYLLMMADLNLLKA